MLVRLRLVSALIALSATWARAQTPNIDAARQHFAAGRHYYDEDRWEDALREFREAYRLSKRPALLFNIGRCNERLRRYDDAITALRQYLQLDPKADDRAEVEQEIAAMDALRAPPPPSEKPAAPPPRRRVATWVVGAVGVALLGAAAGTALWSHSDYDSLAGQCGQGNVDCPRGFESTRDEGQNLQWASYALAAAGGVALVTSIVLFFVEGRQANAPPAAVTPLVLPGPVSVDR